VDEAAGITRGEVRAIMLALAYIGAKLDVVLELLDYDEDEDEEEAEPQDE
jgi:hypothetical protein